MTDEARTLVSKLAASLGVTKTAIIEIAVREFAKSKGVESDEKTNI